MEAVSSSIKGYELRDRIEAGGFGAVYRAYQTTVGREVAIKIILPGLANQPEFIRRFETEAQLVARLEHPHITPLYDYWRDPGGAYLVMRWLRGGSVRDALQNGPFDLRSTSSLLEQVAGALSLAHRHQVIHRDIKPGNILLDEDGNAYLTDFGIAKDLGVAEGGTQPDAIVGSLDYLSPEQARSEPITPRTDIYSLGVTLYEVITGAHPFQGLSPVERLYKHINDPLPEITTLDAAVGEAVNRVIQKATAKDPDHRYPDALAFAADFREAAGSNRTPTSVVEMLTQREHEILQLIIEGLSNKEIAQRLTVTLSTIKWHVNQIYAKLGVRSRVQAMVRARELNLIVKPGEMPLAVAIPTEDFHPENPYKGLHAFTAADHQDFFGRERVTARLVERLGETGEYARFLTVVGPSGSGKSSLVKAGLIPALWRGDLPGSEKWFIVDMLPGPRPLDELEIALTKIAANQAGNLYEHLRRDEYGLLRSASLILPNDGSELVLIIDQFEEVFTLVEDESVRSHFLDLLHAAVTEPRSRVRVVITLRADFYDRPLHYVEFGELVRSRLETVLPLSADELERAIVGPVERVGVVFEDGLVSSMVADIKYQPGALPLLQYALTELFERRQGRMLTREAYQAIGGSTGALAKRAEEIYEGLSDVGQEAARQMFLRLVTLGEGAEDTRRRVPRSELLGMVHPRSERNGDGSGADLDLMDEIIDIFAAYRLLSLDNDPATRSPTVEVAHEAILREWERLRQWLNDSRDDIKIQRRLAGMADEWHTAHQDTSYLARGSRLEQFEHWAAETKLALTPAEQEYLNASLVERERQETAEKARQARELRLERRSRNFLRGLVAVLLLATLGALGLSRVALNERDRAEVNFALSESQRLAAEANLLLANDGSNELAALLGIHALQSAYSPQADMALQHAARQSFGERIYFAPTDIADEAFSPDGSSILFALYDGTVLLYDAQSGDVLWQSTQFMDVPLGAVSPDDKYALVTDGAIHLLDMATGQEVRQFTDPSWVGPAVFSPDGRSILAAGEGSSWIQDIQSGEVLRQFDGGATDAAFSPDGHTVITLNADGIVRLWDARSGQEIRQMSSQATGQSNLVVSPDGRYAAAGNGNTARLWDIQTGEQIQEFVGHAEVITSIAYSPDGRYLATGSMDSSARLWDVTTGLEVRLITAHRAVLFALAFSPDGRYLLTGSRDGSARLWDLQAPAESDVLTGTPGFSYGIVYSPDLRYLATASAGDIYLWDNTTGQHLRTFSVPGLVAVRGITFSPDGRYLLAADMGDQTVRLFDVQTGETVHVWEGSGLNGPAIFTPDGREALVSTPTGMFFYDVETGDQVRHFDTEQGNQYLTYSPDHRYLVTSGPQFSAQNAYLWDAQTSEKLRTFTGYQKDITSLAFSPDGRYVVAGGDDTTVVFWDVQTGEVVQTLTGHTLRMYSLTFSIDGNTLLTGSMDGTARLWDWRSGRELRRYVVPGFVGAAIFSPDEQYVLIGSSDGKVYIAPTSIDDLIQSVCRRVLRDLSPAERVQYGIRSEEPTCEDRAP